MENSFKTKEQAESYLRDNNYRLSGGGRVWVGRQFSATIHKINRGVPPWQQHFENFYFICYFLTDKWRKTNEIISGGQSAAVRGNEKN